MGASPGTEVTVAVAPNTDQISAAVRSFVSDYNNIVSSLNSQFAYNSTTGKSGVLSGDSTVRMLQNDLLSAISGSASGSVTLGSLGISMNNDGTLTLDNSTLNSTLQNNFSAVQTFFQGTSQNGFANQFNDQLQDFTDPASGAFTLDLQSISSEITDLQDQINNFETYTIATLQKHLTDNYNQAEQLLMSMPVQQQQLQAELGYTGTNNR
jgi:flagellar hook-associated protein 2